MEDHVRFMKKTHRISHDMNPNWRQCLNTDCDFGQFHVSPKPEWGMETDVFHCTWNCQSKACVKCDRPWHEGQSCEEFNESIASQREQEMADREYIERLKKDGEIKGCPNCACAVEREMPVNVVRCSRCFYYIRWTVPTEAKTKKVARVSSGEEALSVTFAENV
ncbi:Putative IBR domain-containing protein [Septoria linicola]|uniref:IBR domain-containing protein n=1 Tax=Septoria linicola TaxID=215465 RepID=A0A9Q9ATI3_9PEZI|nr:putative IBR domain-containing protein [Septoria linicola]USW52270.1 Putative IBR domain-containing protein [Septoria linicola]